MAHEPDLPTLAMVQTLYHYTSIDTVLKVIQEQTLRFSSVDHMNDPNECRHFERLAMAHLHENPTLTDQQRQSIRAYFLEDNGQVTLATYANSYCFCMSMRGDDLSQWRGYGDEGYGVAIGFSKYALLEFKARDSILMELAYVNYSEEVLLRHLRTFDHSPLSQSFNGTDLTAMRVALNLKRCAPFYKHHAYRHEEEWRLLFTPAGYVMGSADGAVDGIQFGAMRRGKIVVPFYDFKFPQRMIEVIRLGPNVSNQTEVGLRLLLDAKGFGQTKLVRSEIGYRS